MAARPFGTCFFEQYAQITLSTFLGGEYGILVNRDRPDLQTPETKDIGIEVTRAMEESKTAQQALLKDIAGITPAPQDEELDQILRTGYAYGLQKGKYIGARELSYWSMALPMRRMEADALKSMNYVRFLQQYLDNRYDILYLADINDLFVCNLAEGLKDSSRIERYHITQDQRKDFFLEALRRQNESE